MRNALAKLFFAGFATMALIVAVSSNARSVKALSASCNTHNRGEWCGVHCEWHDVRWCPEWLCPSHWDCSDTFFPTGVEPCDATCVPPPPPG